jgi:predicted Zn-dependent peptidase
MKDGGVLEAYMETSNPKMEHAKDALVSILNNLYEKGISKDALAVENLNTWSSFLRMMEIRLVRGETVALFESLGLGFTFYADFFNELMAVTPQGFNTYLKQVLDPEKRIIVVVGPSTEDKALQVDQ